MKDLFRALLTSALNSGGLGQYRTVSADTLSVWAQRSVQCCSISNDASVELGQLFSNDDAERIFSFVCDFWTDSGAALGNAIKELFVKLISLLTKVRPAEQLDEILHNWTKRVLNFPKTLRVLYFTLEILVKLVGGNYVLQNFPEFTSQALLYMGSNTLANPIGKTLYALYSSILTDMAGNVKTAKISNNTVIKWTNLWAPATRLALIDPSTREHVQTYFLPQMFKRLPASLKYFIKPFMEISSETPEDEISVLVGCLKIGQELNIIDLSRKENDIIDPEFLESLFHHSSPSLRISALSLLVTSPQGSKPIPLYSLEVIQRSLDNFFYESDSGFRNQFYGFMRQLIFRVRGSSYAMARESRKLKERDEVAKAEKLDEQVAANKEFCIWLVGYLGDCLRPGSSYQYIFTSILMITLLVQSGLDDRVSSIYYEKQHTPFPFHFPIYNDLLMRLLMDSIANGYEDIRSGAAKILKMAPLPVGHVSSYENVDVISNQVYKTISGIRGREGDAGARGAELVFHLFSAFPSKEGESIAKSMEFFEQLLGNLEQHVEYAKNDLPFAVREYPIHGYYSALRFIIENINFKLFIKNESDVQRWHGYVKRLTDSIFEIWNTVESILCHDSPEGNLPQEFESNFQPGLEAQYGPATQVILSYSWRAVKESTSLLEALLDRIPNNSDIFPPSLVTASGEVVLTQLATVHHRGAFSSVYPTFISCCKRCNRTKELTNQPTQWLSDNLALIKIKAQYITRRSGGLPFLITAVLTAEIDSKKPLLAQTFNNLYTIAKSEAITSAEEKLDLPQVHAFNCIKALFVETELSTSSAPFVDQALELAITSFSHPIWAIRNCAVMLFTALQNRLFGTARLTSSKHNVSTISARLFFSKYKTVRQVLLDILQQHVENLTSENPDSSHVETVFPVLSLLARLEGTNGYEGLNDFKPLILVCLKSKIWKTREMAARTLPPLLNEQDIFEFSAELLASATLADQNGLHGACLAVHNIINRHQEKHAEAKQLAKGGDLENFVPSDFVQFLFTRFDEFVVSNPCAETAQGYFRILKSIYVSLLEYDESIPEKFTGTFIPYCFTEWTGKKMGLNAVERCLQSELANVALISLINESTSSGRVEYISSLILDSRYEVQLMAIGFLQDHLKDFSATERATISSACWKLVTTADWDQVKGPAIRLFSTAQQLSPTEAATYWSALYSYITPHATEEINESCLESLGVFTGQQFLQDDGVETVDKWILLLKEYSHENQAFPSRQAALNSLLSFLRTMPTTAGSTTKPIFEGKKLVKYLETLFQLLSFLSDDDEDIRDTASAYTSEFLGQTFISTSVYCEKALLRHIRDISHGSTAAHTALLDLLFSRFTDNNLASKQLEAAFTDDNLLFSFEKQNLYKDELRDVTQYFDAFGHELTTGPRPLDKTITQRLVNWVDDALESSAALVVNNPRKTGYDGVLGWTKDPEVFLCFSRLKLAVGLARTFNLLSQSSKPLVELIRNAGKEADIHPLLEL